MYVPGVTVAQWLEHCVSSTKVVGSIPREHMYWQKKCITWMHCKSLWIKASDKCINVYNWNACSNVKYEVFLTFSESKHAMTLPFSTWQLFAGCANLHSASEREHVPRWNSRHTSRVSHFVSRMWAIFIDISTRFSGKQTSNSLISQSALGVLVFVLLRMFLSFLDH